MPQHYTLDWLTEKYENGDKVKFIYFWGNTNTGNEVSKSCFSQWFDSPFTVNSIVYKTSEHWMMAQKALLFNDNESFERIINCQKPGEAKDIGREIKNFNNEIWENERFDIVKNGNIHKFNQNRDLGNFLLNTNDRILVEASPVDTIWGVGLAADSDSIKNIYLWRGTNLLGFALMEARNFLSEFGFFEPSYTPFLPPWLKYEHESRYSMFWRMGKGEDYIIQTAHYLAQLNEKEKQLLELTCPEPYEWKGWYKS
jgi:ribA/ribD-fused uncharacterized protein